MTETTPAAPAAPATRRPKDRRRSIELAAAELFASEGFVATGLSDIAAKVGVTPAAIYRHFAGKDALLETILVDAVTQLGDAAQEAERGAGLDARLRLRRVLETIVDLAHDSPDAVTIYVRERHRLTGEARTRRHESEQQVADRVRGLVEEIRPGLTEVEMTLRLRALNGVLASAAVRRHSVPLPRLRELYVDGVTALLLAPPDPRAATTPTEPRTWSPPSTRRAEILDAAARLFRLDGYRGAGIDQIGEAAGIAGSTVYGTFSSKADILVDAVDRAVAMLEVLTDRALSRAASAEEALELLATSYAETILTNLDIVAVAARDMRHLPEPDLTRIRRRQEDYRQRAQAVLLELRPDLTEAEARTVFSGAYDLVGEVALGRHVPSPPWMAAVMVTFLRAGAAPPASVAGLRRARPARA